MEINNYKRKFKDLFHKFFKENFELSIYYSENLLKYLRDSPDKRAEKILETPFFSDLIIYSLTNLENVTCSVKIFIVGVLKIMMTNELQCSKFVQLQGMELMSAKVFKTPTCPLPPPALEVAGIELCSAIISHSTGILWTLQTKMWTRIFSNKVHTKAPMLSKAAYNYMSKLIWKLDEYDEEAALIEVLTYIVNPIRNNEYLNTKFLDAEGEKAFYEPILSSLNCLLVLAGEVDNVVRKNKAIPILTHYLFLKSALTVLMDVTRNEELICLVTRVIFRIYVGSTLQAYHNTAEAEMPQEITIIYYNTINRIMHKRLPLATIHFSVDCLEFWSKVDKSNVSVATSFVRHGRTYDVRDQFLISVIIPLITHSYNVNLQNKRITELLDAYYYKLAALATEHIVKAAYTFRSLIEHDSGKNTAIECLKQLFKMKNCLSESQAGIVYQALFYIVQYYVVRDEQDTVVVGDNPISCPDDIKLLSLVLESIKMLLKDHNINWYESVEVISLQNCLMNLLKQNLLPAKQLLQAVDLIDLSIRKFLSPDLALLMESRRGSTLNEIVAITKTFIQHQDWEIRDSALHLLLSCTELAYVKYIPMQKLLYENDLMVQAAHAALYDEESYVQTTAMRCLAAATKVESIWKHVLVTQPNFNCQLVHIMKNHPEGIVRKEAANVLLELYIHQKMAADFIQYLFTTMTSAALDDLHWEVQIVALQFWKVAIQYQLSNRGMIDGKFPAVTFCKIRRKIMVLNEKVIEDQLIGIMNELAETGCLTVLDKCLNEEHHIDVIELAYSIAKDLMSILECYKFENVPENMIRPQTENNNTVNTNYIQDMSVDLTFEAEFIRQQVIESIVSTNQSELIQNLYDQCHNIKTEPNEENILTSRTNKWMNPNRFIRNFRGTNYLGMIEDKRNWNAGPNSLDRLLDEILTLGEVRRDVAEECE